MTKLMEWLIVASILSAIWGSLVTKTIDNEYTRKYMQFIIFSPIIFVGLFGLYAVTVVLYRVFTFNNCEEAAKELQMQILEAKKDLKSKGFVFNR